MKIHEWLTIVAATAVAATNSGAAQAQATPPDQETVQAHVEEARVRLKLTPEQETQIKPLIEKRAADLSAIRARHAGDTSRRARREMYREAKPVLEDYQDKVRAILSDEQEVEWEKMREEARQKIRDRQRSGADPA